MVCIDGKFVELPRVPHVTGITLFCVYMVRFWGAEGAPILFSEIGFCMASCSYIYIYIYIYIYVYICQDGGAVGFVDFTKLLFALYSLALPLKRVRSIAEHVFVIISQRKACAGRFREETAKKRTGPITRWPLRRLMFTQLEIVFVTISLFIKRTKVAQNVFQEG